MKISLTIVLLFGLTGQVFACKCNDPGTVKESFDVTPVIISGQVIKREIVSFAETIQSDKILQIEQNLKLDPQKLNFFRANFIFKVQLLVTEKFKGTSIPDTVTIYTTITGASCGYKFEEGKEYIIYGSMQGFYSHFLMGQDKKKELKRNIHTGQTIARGPDCTIMQRRKNCEG